MKKNRKTCIGITLGHCLFFAMGDSFAFASDRDINHPQFFEKRIVCAQKHPQTHLFHCRISVIEKTKTSLIWRAPPSLHYGSQLESNAL